MIDIKAKKLFSYLHPFQDLLPGQYSSFNKEAIKNRLLKGDIYHDPDDDLISNVYRKIAYLVTYPEDLFIKLTIPNTQDDLKNMLVNENDNVLVYAALAYLNKDIISVDLEGNHLFAKTFFNVSQKTDFLFSQDAIHCNNESIAIEWVVKENLLLDSWGDKDFVLNNLNGQNIDTNHKLVPHEFWEDATFFTSLMKKYIEHDSSNSGIFHYALHNHKYNPHFLHYVMNSHQSFSLFKSHYFNDYQEYKKGNLIHPEQKLLESLIVTPNILYKWMRSFYSDDILNTCFPLEMLQSKETILEHYQMVLSGNSHNFDPIFGNKYNPKLTPLSFVLEKSKEWKLDIFESLVDIFIKNNQRNSYHRSESFDKKYNFLLFSSINISDEFIDLIKDMPATKKEIYIKSLSYYCQHNGVKLGQEISNLIIQDYPQYFNLLDKKYRTLPNLKNLIHYNIDLTTEELLKFNDKELNLHAIDSHFCHIFLKAFPLSYIQEEDYILALINQKSSFVEDNKSLIKFIEKNETLSKVFISKGFYKKLSPKIFENISLSEHLIGTVFSEGNQGKYHLKNMFEAKELVNPIVFSHLQSLEKIFILSHGNFLKECTHLFIHKPFVKMVLKLYDQGNIHNMEYLPAQIRLVFDSYKITNNFESFFIKYDLQNTLINKLSDNKINQNDNKINQKNINKI